MSISNMQGHIWGLIEEIKNAERITKVKLALLSRDILPYVMDTKDIAAVNRLVEVLTPMNKATAILFFKHFLPWEQETTNDDVHVRFGKMVKGDKKFNRKQKLISEFLSEEGNTIWTWADTNVDLTPKKKQFAAQITKIITQSLNGDEKSDTPPLEMDKIIEAIFEGGVSIDDMLVGVQLRQDKIEAEKAAAAEVVKEAA